MAFGRSAAAPPPPQSTFSKLAPLLFLLILLAVVGYVGFLLYQSFQDISKAANDKLQSKNVVFTKDGMRVGVKEIKQENYVDSTQSFLVKAWNLSTWPAYKSKLWNKNEPQEKAQARKAYSRKTSNLD